MTHNEPTGLTEAEMGSVSSRFTELGLKVPSTVCILPANFLYADKQSDLYFAPRSPDFKVLLREAGILVDKIEPEGVRIPYRDDRDSTLMLPALFLVASYLSGNDHLLSVALSVVANYVTDYFRGKVGANRVKCSVFIEESVKKTTKKVEYDGSPEGFDRLIDAIKRALK